MSLLATTHTRHRLETIAPEYPEYTQIEPAGERGRDVTLYRVRFSRLGENRLTVRYGKDRYLRTKERPGSPRG